MFHTSPKAGRVTKLAMLSALLVAGTWIHRTALADIISIGWGREEQSHILLAPFIALWLFWLRRSRLRSMPITPSLWGTVFVALGWVLSWWGMETDTQVAWHCGALVTLLGCVVTMTGLAPVRQFAPAVFAMVFFIPIPGLVNHAIALPLQAMASGITEMMLELLGIPATRLGHVLLINGEHVAVGEACNGMRMVFALWLIVYAFAFSTPLRMSVRGVLFVLSPVVALLCNIIRLIPTTLVFGYGTVEQAERFHAISGWVMLPVAIFMLLGIVRTIRWIELPVMIFRLAMP
jgi:exosortase